MIESIFLSLLKKLKEETIADVSPKDLSGEKELAEEEGNFHL